MMYETNPKIQRDWLIDWRDFDPKSNANSKLRHMQKIFDQVVQIKKLPFRVVPMAAGYGTKDLMRHLHRACKIFYCPIKINWGVDESGGGAPYRSVSDLQWRAQDGIAGKLIKVHGLPGALTDEIFRVVITTNRREWIVMNDLDQSSTDDTRDICGIRWRIEQYHREVKQTLGLEKCQCRSATAQRNHIGCMTLAWNSIRAIAKEMKTNIHTVKKWMLSAYMRQELTQPSLQNVYRIN